MQSIINTAQNIGAFASLKLYTHSSHLLTPIPQKTALTWDSLELLFEGGFDATAIMNDIFDQNRARFFHQREKMCKTRVKCNTRGATKPQKASTCVHIGTGAHRFSHAHCSPTIGCARVHTRFTARCTGRTEPRWRTQERYILNTNQTAMLHLVSRKALI